MFYINQELTTTDKFDMSLFLDSDGTNSFDPLTSYFLSQISNLPLVGYYTIRKEEGRPDYLSYNLYGDTQYWWILMLYNGLIYPEELTVGLKIKYPSSSALSSLYMTTSLYKKTES